MSSTTNPGPTVFEATTDRIRQIDLLIANLKLEQNMLMQRREQFRYNTMLESERRATAAEPYQRNPLPAD